MTKNNKRTMNVITSGIVAVVTALLIVTFSCAPVHALSYSLNYLDNGDGTLYDEEQGCYVDMDTYHAAYGYEYDEETNSYVYRTDYDTYVCTCTACTYWKEGHKIVIPGQESENNADNSDQELNVIKVFVVGTELSDDNLSGAGWSYDMASNTLTLDSYNYEGTGLFQIASAEEDTSEDEALEENGDNEDYGDEEYDDWEDDEEAWEDDDSFQDGDEDAGESDAEETESETAEPLKGVIRSEGDLTINLNGESHITVTDEESDASYAINVAGELKVEGDGVLYVKTAAEEKIYGNEPKEEDPNVGNSGNINNNNNNNDIDNTQTVNEAPVTQTVDDGDVAVSNNNNVDMPDFSNSISLPGASNNISFNPSIEVKLPENSVERIVLSGMQNRYPEVVKSTNAALAVGCGSNAGEDLKTASTENKESKSDGESQVASTSDGTKSKAPQTGDSMDLGVLMALIATIIMCGGAGGFMLWKRIRGY